MVNHFASGVNLARALPSELRPIPTEDLVGAYFVDLTQAILDHHTPLVIYFHEASTDALIGGGEYGEQTIQTAMIPAHTVEFLNDAIARLDAIIDLDFSISSSVLDSDIRFYLDQEISFADGLAIANRTVERTWWEVLVVSSIVDRADGYFEYALIHEFGHVLGLEHPFDNYDGDFFVSTDARLSALPEETVMSYRQPASGHYPNWYSDNDIRALIEIWGPETKYGTQGDDLLTGLVFNDHLNAGAGNDVLFGLAGNDWLEGGPGNDSMLGGSGADTLDGAEGWDTAIYIDSVLALPDDQLFRIEAENLLQLPEAGGVKIDLGQGTVQSLQDPALVDTLINVESLIGSTAGDIFDASGFVSSGSSATSPARNAFEGLTGDDRVIGNGNTEVRYEYATGGVEVNLTEGNAQSTQIDTGDTDASLIGRDSLQAVNHIFGSQYDDWLYGSDSGNHIQGADGDDTIVGLAGRDQLTGGAGDDQLFSDDAEALAVYSGKRSDYRIEYGDRQIRIVDTRPDENDGADTLNNIHLLRFSDTTHFELRQAVRSVINDASDAIQVGQSKTFVGTRHADYFEIQPDVSPFLFAGDDDVIGLPDKIGAYDVQGSGTQLRLTREDSTIFVNIAGEVLLSDSDTQALAYLDTATGIMFFDGVAITQGWIATPTVDA